MHTLTVNDQQLASILAGLRALQERPSRLDPATLLYAIASNLAEFRPLSDNAIDKLADYLNGNTQENEDLGDAA